MDRKWREGENLDLRHLAWNRVDFLTCGHGERPWFAFVWIGAFVGFGWVLFHSKGGMGLIDLKQADAGYDPFGCSLGQPFRLEHLEDVCGHTPCRV